MLVETCPFTHQAYIALTCNKGGRFSARYVLKAHAAELIQKLNSSLSAVKRHSPVSCWHGLFPVGGTRSPHSLEDLADLGQRHGRGAKLGWRKANRGSVDMKQFDSVRVVGQCRPGAPHPSCWSVNGAGTVLVFAPAGVTNAAGLTCCRVIKLVLWV